MGRTEPSIGLAPASQRRDARAKHARTTLHKTIPALLASNSRARNGVPSAELIIEPGPVQASISPPASQDITERLATASLGGGKGKGRRRKASAAAETPHTQAQPREDAERHASDEPPPPPPSIPEPPRITLQTTDTLTAARHLYANGTTKDKSKANLAILNMASPLRPGGGFLNGATSQEEYLCLRTTLLPSLQEEFYRLPDVGGVWTPDVLVFRGGAREAPELRREERFFVGVVTAGMLRHPEVDEQERPKVMKGKDGGKDADNDEASADSEREEEAGEGVEMEKVYANAKDRELAERQMRAVMRIMVQKKVEKCVVGAWGCGAYGNPVGEIARAWKKVLLSTSSSTKKHRNKKARDISTEYWHGLKEVVFAIKERRMAREFAREFGDGLEIDTGAEAGDDSHGEEEADAETRELEAKVEEMEGQVKLARNPDLRVRLEAILDSLRAQLAQKKPGLRSESEGWSESEADE